MQDSKLIELLRQLSKREFKRLELFFASPYFNRRAELVQLLNYLKKYAPEFDHKALTKQKSFAAIHPDEKYSEKKMGYYLSFSVQLVEEFMAAEIYDQRSVYKQTLLLHQYNDWGMESAFYKVLKNAKRDLNKKDLRDADFYFDQFILENAENSFFDKQNRHLYDESVQRAANHLDTYYLSVKLRFCCEMVNRQKLVERPYDLRFMDEILEYLDNKKEEQVPPVEIYYTILKGLLHEEDESHFQKLKRLYNKYYQLFNDHEAKEMYLYIINYCVRKINGGKSAYYKELFDIYKFVLKNNILLENKVITPWSYANIVTVGVRNNQFKWTYDFIQEYKSKLDKKVRSNAYAYNLAYWHFNKGDFSKAQEMLTKVKFEGLIYNLTSRVLLMRIYYELDEHEPLFSLAESFRKYVKRNSILAAKRREPYLNFIKLTTKLARTPKSSKARLKSLEESLNEDLASVNKPWILEKIREKIQS